MIMHVTCQDRVERTIDDGEAMHASIRREQLERLQADGIVFMCGRSNGRARHGDVDGEGTSQGNYFEVASPGNDDKTLIDLKLS